MPKKASAKGGTKKRKAGRKPLDLPVKAVRGGDAASIKGGISGESQDDAKRNY